MSKYTAPDPSVVVAADDVAAITALSLQAVAAPVEPDPDFDMVAFLGIERDGSPAR
ncbi:hypothetical protein SAMN05444374_11613 [Rhodococcoides kroppenstedtii]|uniref:Uncharacterized protein n=1 Tax=Rhodococcoides kroppenstedtii TaxID=293050 RepID=A0A1I0UA95_9NOCA|nr:hypothetical protein [Rhodococcus kroppenstedtii]SFA60747.1 hypothetical protein SAMN05444374_11613 [Rhodococcus kroppenstedtii]